MQKELKHNFLQKKEEKPTPSMAFANLFGAKKKKRNVKKARKVKDQIRHLQTRTMRSRKSTSTSKAKSKTTTRARARSQEK